MKNNCNLIPTHSKKIEINEHSSLELKIDIDATSEVINGLYYKFYNLSDLESSYVNEVKFLEENIKNISVHELFRFFDLNPHNASLPSLLLVDFIKEYLGIFVAKERNDIICSCFGLTKVDLSLCFVNENFISYPEIVSKTKASAGCGSCADILKKEYCANAYKQYYNKVFTRNFNEKGEWLKFKNLTLAKVILKINAEIGLWLTSVNEEIGAIQILSSEGYHLTFAANTKTHYPEIEKTLSELVLTRVGLLVFFTKSI